MHLCLDLTGPFCPISNHGSHITLLKFQVAPKPKLLISSSSKIKEPAQVRMSEWGQSFALKECGSRFPLSPRTSCRKDCQAALVGKDVSSGCSPLILHQVASDRLCLQVFRRSSESWTEVSCTLCMTTRPITQMNWVSRKGTSWSCFVKGTSGNESGGGLDSVTRRAIFHGTCLGYVFFKVQVV